MSNKHPLLGRRAIFKIEDDAPTQYTVLAVALGPQAPVFRCLVEDSDGNLR